MIILNMTQERSEPYGVPPQSFPESFGEVPLFPYEQLARIAVYTFGEREYIRRAINGITQAAQSIFVDPNESAYYAKQAIEEALKEAPERRIKSWEEVIAEKFDPRKSLNNPRLN